VLMLDCLLHSFLSRSMGGNQSQRAKASGDGSFNGQDSATTAGSTVIGKEPSAMALPTPITAKGEDRWNRYNQSSIGNRTKPGSTIATSLRPPATALSTESTGSTPPISVDPHAYRAMVQDITVVKTLLLRLKSELQKADTINPFDSVAQLSGTESSEQLTNGQVKTGLSNTTDVDKTSLHEENENLRKQLAVMKQQLWERDHRIRKLQEQVIGYQRGSADGSSKSGSKMEVDL